MIDLHCHLLPAVDDGPVDMQASLAMARAAVADGVEAIVATPHVSSRYSTDPATIAGRVQALQWEIDAAGIPLKVHSGAEINLTAIGDLNPDQLSACALGSGRHLLLEAPFSGPVPFIDRMVHDLQLRGWKVVLAHPERISAFQKDLGLLERLVEQGVLCSVTAGSLAGSFGKPLRRFSLELFERGLVHNISSDAHGPSGRAPVMREALATVPELAGAVDWLTHEVPEAVLVSQALRGQPPRLAPKRRLLGRLRG
jgi:protein-tyrosine phosphatase